MTPRTRTLGILLVFSVMLGASCREPTSSPGAPLAPDASLDAPTPDAGAPDLGAPEPAFDPARVEPAAYLPPDPIDAAAITVDAAQITDAPQRYSGVVGRLTMRDWRRHRNLVYEGNNLDVRGERMGDGGPYRATGRETALRWREWASGVRGVFVLRDSLFSQQDHPVEQHGFAPMFGPNWITVIADRASRGAPLKLPELPALTDPAPRAKPLDPHAMLGNPPHRNANLRPASAAVYVLARGYGTARSPTHPTRHTPHRVPQ